MQGMACGMLFYFKQTYPVANSNIYKKICLENHCLKSKGFDNIYSFI